MPPLKAPVLSASADSSTSVSLDWTTSGPNPTDFTVFRDDAVVSPALAGTVRTYTDSTVTAGGHYIYKVRARRDASSVFSNPVPVDVPTVAITTAPALTGTAGDSQCSLSWTAVANATAYQLQRKTGAGAYADISTANVLAFSDTGRTNATVYTYRVRGTSSGGNGPWSNERALEPTASVPVAPVLTGEAGDSENTLHSTTVANADKYRFRYRLVPGGQAFVLGSDTALTDYTDDTATNGIERIYSVRGVTAAGVLGSVSNELPLTAEAAMPPPDPAIVGYGANTTGGTNATAGNTFTVTTYAGLAAKVALNTERKITFGADINGAGATLNINYGNLTLNGAGYRLKRCNIKNSASNVIFEELNIHPGDNVDNVPVGAAIMLNAGDGNVMRNIVIRKCSLGWATDACLNMFNQVEDVTIQENIVGPGITNSAAIEASVNPGPHGYGMSSHHDPTWPRNVTIYRNFFPHNRGRSIRVKSTDGIDVVNNVVYNQGPKGPLFGNVRGGNMLGNMYKKGPNSTGTNGWLSDLDTNETYYLNSVYYPNGSNIGLNYTPTDNFATSVKRGGFYPQGATGPYNVTPQAANSTLAAAVVAAAGPTNADTGGYNATFRTNYTAGTGSWWNGPGGDGGYPVYPAEFR